MFYTLNHEAHGAGVPFGLDFAGRHRGQDRRGSLRDHDFRECGHDREVGQASEADGEADREGREGRSEGQELNGARGSGWQAGGG